MIRIIFICHGNICRSPMAEFIFRDLARKKGVADRFSVVSRALSAEELGNPVYPPARRVLSRLGISTDGKRAELLTKKECDEADYLVIMDAKNRRMMTPYLPGNEKKLSLLTEWFGAARDVADPWYTGDFEATLSDVRRGCEAMLERLI